MGSTCYVNSLLQVGNILCRMCLIHNCVIQVWFHNDQFRSVLFSYNAFPDIITAEYHAISTSGSSSDELPPTKKLRCSYLTTADTIQHLQLLLTRLCYSQLK